MGGGVYVMTGGTFQIVNGTIYGNTEADTGLRNTDKNGGASLFNHGGIAQHGRFDGLGGAWKEVGNLTTRDTTIIVVNGVLIKLPATTAEDAADFDGNAPDGTFTVSSLADWDAAIDAIKNGGNDKNYVITVDGDFTVPGDTAYTFGTATGIKVSLRGSGTLGLSSNGSIIRTAPGQTVILRDLTPKGSSGNNASVVRVSGAGSAVVMHSGTITGNTSSTSGGGVYVDDDTTFTMYGGEISGNTASTGGGVYVRGNSLFVMYGGTIFGNTSTFTHDSSTEGGGGVFLAPNATFRLITGIIYGSNATPNTLRNTITGTGTGAALYVYYNATAQRGTFDADGTWTSSATLATTNNTINVKDGVNQ
jgi:predicted outer membrane repeat protein